MRNIQGDIFARSTTAQMGGNAANSAYFSSASVMDITAGGALQIYAKNEGQVTVYPASYRAIDADVVL